MPPLPQALPRIGLALVVLASAPSFTACDRAGAPTGDSASSAVASAERMKPEDLAKVLSDPASEKPIVLHVGVKMLYDRSRIAGSRYVGEAGDPDGLDALKANVKDLPRDKEIVLYCGCCPWQNCPNVKPAYRTMKDMGFTRVKLLYLPTTLKADWIDHGFPTERG